MQELVGTNHKANPPNEFLEVIKSVSTVTILQKSHNQSNQPHAMSLHHSSSCPQSLLVGNYEAGVNPCGVTCHDNR
jgi:hypothetical protein